MKRIPLAELVAEKGQQQVADMLGVSAPAISKAIKAGRSILVELRDDGACEAEELRRFPAQAPSKKQRAA